ncbi:MAG: type IV pilin protein, partial [Gaiellaceae bacterium]
VILGILVAIAVPSYLSFRGNAQDAAAKSNVRSAIPAAEGFYQVGSTYTAMTLGDLQTQAPGVSNDVAVYVSGDGTAYCIDDAAVTGHTAYYIGGEAAGFGALTSDATLSTVTGGSVTAGDATCANVGATAGS